MHACVLHVFNAGGFVLGFECVLSALKDLSAKCDEQDINSPFTHQLWILDLF